MRHQPSDIERSPSRDLGNLRHLFGFLRPYRTRLVMASLALFVAAGAVLAFVIFAWDKASGLSQEEKKEVSILKLLGWQTSDIIFLRFCESLTVSFLAFLAGYLLAWMHVVFFDGAVFRPVFLGWSVLRPVFSLVPSFAVGDLLLIFSLSVIPYLCATAVPAWRAATVRADSVI